jgi:hypothetical protein
MGVDFLLFHVSLMRAWFSAAPGYIFSHTGASFSDALFS